MSYARIGQRALSPSWRYLRSGGIPSHAPFDLAFAPEVGLVTPSHSAAAPPLRSALRSRAGENTTWILGSHGAGLHAIYARSPPPRSHPSLLRVQSRRTALLPRDGRRRSPIVRPRACTHHRLIRAPVQARRINASSRRERRPLGGEGAAATWQPTAPPPQAVRYDRHLERCRRVRGHGEYVADRTARRRQKTNDIVALATVVWPRLRSSARGSVHGATEPLAWYMAGFSRGTASRDPGNGRA